ncbi:GGDEF domain-containing protein [Burkholderiaceae bacterium DAT-1]|nr:GGDEF domain-containing protein [Burkholderiaceae bacterium DAT-1]
MHGGHSREAVAQEVINQLIAEGISISPDTFRERFFHLIGRQMPALVPWSGLIEALIRQWDIRNAGFSPVRKREMLSSMLRRYAHDAEGLNENLNGMIERWEEAVRTSRPIEVAADEAPQVEKPVQSEGWQALSLRLLDAFAQKGACPYPELEPLIQSLLQQAQQAMSAEDVQKVEAGIWVILKRLDHLLRQDQRVSASMRNLFDLMLDNISVLSGNDAWMDGQLALLRGVLEPPVKPMRLYHAEQTLGQLVNHQRERRQELDAAQQEMKSLIASMVDRIGQMAASTGGFGDRVQHYERRIAAARELADIRDVLQDLSVDTRRIHGEIDRSRVELDLAREQVQLSRARIDALEAELKSMSEKVREDQLTGALNRRGFDEAFGSELARMQRTRSSLTIAMLDIDNFKMLNDRLGHHAGDDALKHLVKVVKDVLRPSDVVARYGGEEFVILLPETHEVEAAAIMQRVQRDLTRRFFMHNREKLLITFSAGVTAYRPGEPQDDAIERADLAMYRAKKAGKNRVFVAEQHEGGTPAQIVDSTPGGQQVPDQ